LLELEAVKAADFFALPSTLKAFSPSFSPDAPPWDWIKAIGEALKAHVFPTSASAFPPGIHISGSVFVHDTVRLPGNATIIGPAWIGPETEIRPGAYIRGNVIVGKGCVLGNSCEFKNCLLLDGVQVPHFSYVGDSILGNRAHLGAGVILSNLRLDQQPIVIRAPEGTMETGLRKFGAILGDEAEVGCNAVLQPGTLMGKRSLVMPTVAFGGVLPAATIARVRESIVTMPRRD
jgi:UDP-N-acetylglucosamine diphosphorylase / glucose-1-phosphate thymidylyltransferase / UDP-N-acetylgalactosamine diphosphorylase / glucosamine-1-phosphate N-acetyltransferase / galactosamine-1-phosphate N-acetyltransferase